MKSRGYLLSLRQSWLIEPVELFVEPFEGRAGIEVGLFFVSRAIFEDRSHFWRSNLNGAPAYACDSSSILNYIKFILNKRF